MPISFTQLWQAQRENERKERVVGNQTVNAKLRAVGKDPEVILNVVAEAVGDGPRYWPAIDAAGPLERKAIAEELYERVDEEANRGMLNEDERAAAHAALASLEV